MLAALRAAAAAGGVEFVAFDGGAAPLETARALFARAAAVVGLHGGQAWPSTPLSSLPHSAPGTSIRTRAPLKTDHAACHAARTHRATHRATVPPTQLANALFMREGSMLLELGFASPLAAHYAHAAAALGLRYEACTRSNSRARPVRILWPSPSTDPSIQVLHVAPDERGVGAHNLTLPPGSAQTVAASVARHLAARATAVPSTNDEL